MDNNIVGNTTKNKTESGPERETPITLACKAWRSILPVHPACEIIPAYDEPKLIELGRDLKTSGMKIPVIVLAQPDGTFVLVDGRSRLDALRHVGIKFEIKLIDGRVIIAAPGYDIPAPIEIPSDKDFNAFAYVLAVNLHRRHLTREDKHAIITTLIAAQPNFTDNAIAKMAGVDSKTVKGLRQKLKGNSEIRISDRVEASGRKARGRRPDQKPKVPVTKPVPSASKTDGGELSIEQHRARMVALTADEPDTPSDKPEPIATTSTKTRPAVSANGFNAEEILAVAQRASAILERPVSAPNRDAAHKEILHLIELLLLHKTLKRAA
jgi:ParB-like chromosome segregation protein Spo0J